MNKDVIYIDVEDDITAIISKVKNSKEKIVALVPPKRIGVLQSAVNLRLLSRAAEQSKKRLVVITTNQALIGLAAAAGLPIAKNLQSKPEVPEITALEVDDEDVIDGNDLPVGEHARQSGDDAAVAAIAATPVLDGADLSPSTGAAKPGLKSSKSGVKVPNFGTFRKKLVLGIGGGVLLVLFLIWAIVLAPHATITVAAKTDDTSINTDVKAGPLKDTSIEAGTIKLAVSKKTADQTIDFSATGSKNVGKKASGTVRYTNNSQSAQSVQAGTRLTASDGLVFIASESVSIPAGTVNCNPFPNCSGVPGTASGGVSAASGGAKYNGADGSLSGTGSEVEAQFDGPASGGTDKIAKVVTAGDVQKAKQELADQESDSAEAELKKNFKGEVKVIDGTFGVDYSDVKSSPAVGEEADDDATLSATVTYRLYGIEKSELDSFLDKLLKKKLEDNPDQRVYDNGEAKAKFQEVDADKKGAEFTLVATAKIGPKLDETKIKDLAKGKQFGDIQASIQKIQGVKDVDVSFFPFWVNTVPGDTRKIGVQFTVDE
jgi:hypothetical protein